MLQYHAIVWKNAPETESLKRGPDHGWNRARMQELMDTAGGYSALDVADKMVATQWYLEDTNLDAAETKAQFLASVKVNHTVAAANVSEKEALIADQQLLIAEHGTNVTEAQTAFDNALNNATTLDGASLLTARNDAQTAYDAAVTAAADAKTAYDVASTALTPATDAWNALDAGAIHESETAVTTQTEVLTAKQVEVDAKQAELDVDTENVTLQTELAVLQNELSTEQSRLTALSDARTAYTDAGAAFSTAQSDWQTAQQANMSASTALGQATNAIDTQSRASQGNAYVSQVSVSNNVLRDLDLRHQTAVLKLAADEKNTALSDEVTLLASQLATAQANLTAAETKVAQQRALQAASRSLEHFRGQVSNAQMTLSQLQSSLTSLEQKRDVLDLGTATWQAQAEAEERKWSDLYHAKMYASRAQRFSLAISECYRNLGQAPMKQLAAANNMRIMSLGQLYTMSGTKGLSENASDQFGLFDYLLSYVGSPFENVGFVEDLAGYTLVVAGMTASQLRDKVLYILRNGVHNTA